MDLIEFTTVVNRAGSGFGVAASAIPALFIRSKTKSWHTLKQRSIWQPWIASFVTMVLAAAVSGGLIKKLSNGFTGSGNAIGQVVGNAAIGQAGDGAQPVAFTQLLSYGGGWIVLIALAGIAFFIWFADGWGTRALYLAGALTGSTWGITSTIGGWTAMVGVPLVSWLSEMVIG
jgi:hypothetical protein